MSAYEKMTNKKKTRKEAEQTEGSKFPSGSRISSKEGQARFVGLKTYIQKSYYDETEQATKNLRALNKSIKDLVAKIEGDQMAKRLRLFRSTLKILRLRRSMMPAG